MSTQQKVVSDIRKLKILLSYWVTHNSQHILENETWRAKAESAGLKEVALELEKVIELSREANRHIERAGRLIEKKKPIESVEKPAKANDQITTRKTWPVEDHADYQLKPIGVIRTPYVDNAPYQPVPDDEGDFRICVDDPYDEGLLGLDQFRYIYVIYFIHRVKKKETMSVSPYWTPGTNVGVFASRSPVRPNNLGLSIVQLKRIVRNEVFTSGLDVFDGTPLLDIKPYIRDLDSKTDANYGWLEDLDDHDHLMLHIKGIPHDY